MRRDRIPGVARGAAVNEDTQPMTRAQIEAALAAADVPETWHPADPGEFDPYESGARPVPREEIHR